jgi:hypothetical protein
MNCPYTKRNVGCYCHVMKYHTVKKWGYESVNASGECGCATAMSWGLRTKNMRVRLHSARGEGKDLDCLLLGGSSASVV